MAIIASGNSKQILFAIVAMSIGLTDNIDGSKLAPSGLAFEPHKSSRGEKDFLSSEEGSADIDTPTGIIS